jgi:hypothetical protein
MNNAFDEALFWPALIAAGGALRKVRVKMTGLPSTDVYVKWDEPTNFLLGNLSLDYQMEYQRDDLPTLAEGDPVTLLDDAGNPLAKGKFKVRQSPVVQDNPGDSRTGFFRHALLTKIA